MKFSKIILFVLSLSTFIACKKEGIEGEVINDDVAADMANLRVPAGFTWTGQANIKVNVKAPTGAAAANGYTVKFYDANPFEGGQLVGQGAVTKANAFLANLTIGTMVKEIYMLTTSSTRSTSMSKMSVLPNLNIDLASVVSQSVDISQMDSPTSPDCTTGCTTQIALTNNANVTVDNGRTICVTGNNLTFDVTFGTGGGTLRICGTGITLRNQNNNAGSSDIAMIITAGSSVTFSNVQLNRANNQLINYGTVVAPNIGVNGEIINYGTFTCNGDYNLNNTQGGLAHRNFGTINIGSSLNINSSRIFTNEGKIFINRDLAVNGGGTLNNKCFISVKEKLQNNNIVNNYGLIKVGDEANLNGNTTFNQFGGAMLLTKNITVNGTIQGNGSSSLVKVTNNTRINGQGFVRGFIQFCDENGIETNNNNGAFTNGATQACDLYIPVTNCNGEGNGTPVCPDADGDGVCDADDCFPNDPTKAFCNAVPTGTIAFEDNFPYAGDYDLNDVLIQYEYKVITNADNKVVKVDAVYKLRATGGANKNGFAVQFPVERSKVSNVSGATLEAGQSKAVLVIFKDMRAEMNVWNTFKGQAIAPEKVYNVSFDISNGPTLAEFGLNFYNPFIWNNGRTDGKGRGYETHLPGQQPTDLADATVFGTGMDATQPGTANTYITKNNRLPWGIHIPARFDYAIEKMVITQAHLKFATWVQSGGTEYADWYMNKPGYRVDANVFVW